MRAFAGGTAQRPLVRPRPRMIDTLQTRSLVTAILKVDRRQAFTRVGVDEGQGSPLGRVGTSRAHWCQGQCHEAAFPRTHTRDELRRPRSRSLDRRSLSKASDQSISVYRQRGPSLYSYTRKESTP